MILDGLYDSEVAAQDEQVGLFIRKLREEDVLDHTLLIIVSDHGEHLGEKQLLGHEFGAYEDLIHVPLLIRDPTGNLPRGATLTSFVSTRRLFHTILTVAGVATSAEEALTLFNVCGPRVGAEAEQETPLAEAESLQEALHRLERRCPGSQKHWIQPRRAVYNGNYKLISIGERDFELYHIQDDPNENVNLSQSLPMMVEQLRQCLPGHTQVTNPTADVTLHQNDPIVLQRLRALGYLE
jgi:arylsulfatase A-like enzyme